MEFLIIGGDAAGMSAASRAKRTQPDMNITVLEELPPTRFERRAKATAERHSGRVRATHTTPPDERAGSLRETVGRSRIGRQTVGRSRDGRDSTSDADGRMAVIGSRKNRCRS